ncbi:putative replication factor-a protein [Aspergillus lucknowensis]|uniref:Replication protein A C-terminal domain-containing protein n=1 Tax=Aspergillus lucknowensis TaxID=176173 RepID=A0ABR4LXC9_9EURO
MPGETTSPAGGKGERNDTLRPITIKQALEATQPFPEANYQIDSHDLGSVVFVGQLRNISRQSTNVTYKLDDGTGEIEAKQWVTPGTEDSMDTADDLAPAANGVEINGYAKVFGKLKSLYGDRKVVTTHSVKPITDINELHCHFLEAAAIHLFFTRGPPPSAGGGGGAKDAAMGGVGAGGYGGETGGGHLPAMSPVARRMYNLLKNKPQTNEGLAAQQIAAELGLPMADVARAGDELLTAGVIFSTVDEQTWALLEY